MVIFAIKMLRTSIGILSNVKVVIHFHSGLIKIWKSGKIRKNGIPAYWEKRQFRKEAEENSLPCGSTSLAILSASELARSELAGDTARMRQLSLVMNSQSIPRICISISTGWSPTGTLVIPGKSISVRFNTEKVRVCKVCQTAIYFNVC